MTNKDAAIILGAILFFGFVAYMCGPAWNGSRPTPSPSIGVSESNAR